MFPNFLTLVQWELQQSWSYLTCFFLYSTMSMVEFQTIFPNISLRVRQSLCLHGAERVTFVLRTAVPMTFTSTWKTPACNLHYRTCTDVPVHSSLRHPMLCSRYVKMVIEIHCVSSRFIVRTACFGIFTCFSRQLAFNTNAQRFKLSGKKKQEYFEKKKKKNILSLESQITPNCFHWTQICSHFSCLYLGCFVC